MMTFTINIDGVETVYTFSDADLLALRHYLLDVPDWVNKAMVGKINSCRDRMCDREWLPRLRQDPTVTSIPVKQDDLVALIVARDDYKDRAAREAEAKAAEIAAAQEAEVTRK